MIRPAGGTDGFPSHSTLPVPFVAGTAFARMTVLMVGVLLSAIAAAPATAQSNATAQSDSGGRALTPQSPAETGSIDQQRGFVAGAGGVNRIAGRRAGDYGPEQRAQELYLDALEKLEGGHDEWASRTFEDLIARYPGTSAASLARRRLGELRDNSSLQPAVLPGAASEQRPDVPPAAKIHALARAPAWDEELRRNAPIQAKLRGQAGDRVFFAAGSADLGSRARTALAAQARWLKTWHEFEAAVEGHADEPGSEAENFKLSQQRAEAVRQRLVDEGVAPSRLAIVASGRTQPVATCTSVGCRAQNRRAVTLVFASGTRERLGLAAPTTSPTVLETAPPVSGTVRPVGATH
jgi:outer membrane protein OmpA-like peptidoglycan-associated protein